MKTCLGCELRQAKFLAEGQLKSGWEPERICEFLCNRFGEKYYVLHGQIVRSKKLGDYIPYVIVDIHEELM